MKHGARFELRETSPGGRSLQLFVDGHLLPSVKSVVYQPHGSSGVDTLTVVFMVGDLIVTKHDERSPQSWLDRRADEAHATVHGWFDDARKAASNRAVRDLRDHRAFHEPTTTFIAKYQ